MIDKIEIDYTNKGYTARLRKNRNTKNPRTFPTWELAFEHCLIELRMTERMYEFLEARYGKPQVIEPVSVDSIVPQEHNHMANVMTTVPVQLGGTLPSDELEKIDGKMD